MPSRRIPCANPPRCCLLADVSITSGDKFEAECDPSLSSLQE